LGDHIETWAQTLAQLGKKSNSTESVAVDAINFLYNRLNDAGNNPCALLRFFRTMTFAELTPHLQNIARHSLEREPEGLVNCLTLLATRGLEPAWNDRFESAGHQVIPLTSQKMIESAPMIAQLINRLGIESAHLVSPSPTLFLNPKDKNYGVFYVPEALGDHSIVAQKGFVEPFKIRSVIGFGGLLPTGDMFAVVCCMRTFVDEKTAAQFSLLAGAIETAINEVRSGKKARARILVAGGDKSYNRLLSLLGREHSVVSVDTIEKAVRVAKSEIFDLVVCDIEFDESRMFDLLQALKKNKQQKPKPFICFRQTPSPFGEAVQTGVLTAAKLSGANAYMDAISMSDNEILSALGSYLPEEIWNA
jgi:CheY-like chemotaxis protein